MEQQIHSLPNGDGSQTLFIGPSGQPRSMLGDMTPAEQIALNEWLATQHGDPKRGGAIDLGLWPGWETVMARRF